MDDRIDFEEIKEMLTPYLDYELKENGSDLARCIFDINYEYHFPEDMCENRTDWETLKERLSNAHWAVIELIGVIEKIVKQ